MDRTQRMLMRTGVNPGRTKDTVRLLEKAMAKAGIPASDRQAFLDWTVVSLWNTFKEERMNNRIMIENEVRDLGIRFSNGTVGKDYSQVFELPADKVFNVYIEGLEELGLMLVAGENGSYSVCGKPVQAGDFTLKLIYETEEGEPQSELSIPIAFNPNPRTLWKNIPTNENTIFYKPDEDSAYIKVEARDDELPRKDMVAASQRGRSHAQEGKPRDDHFALYHCEDSDWYIIAVADGAGSARFSRKGSEVACNTVVDHCKARLIDNPDFENAIKEYADDKENKDKRTEVTRHVIDIIFNGAKEAHNAVANVAATNEESSLKDFSTTLMFAICKKYEFGWFLASFWVGDGAMCLYDEKEKTAKLLGTPDEGEFSGQTRFLTMREIFSDRDVVSKRLRMAVVPDFTALFLMTDGVSDPMFETDKNLNDYGKWEEFYNTLKGGFPDDGIEGVDLSDDNQNSKDQLLKWLDFWSPGNHDDRTIAILY